MQIRKHFMIIFLAIISLVVLSACTDDSGNDSKSDKKEEYQSKLDLSSIYQSEEELKIAKDLIGSYYKNIEGKKVNGSSYNLSQDVKDKFVVLKMNNLDITTNIEDYQEFTKFANARTEVIALDVFANIKDKNELETYYNQTNSDEKSNTNLVYTSSTKLVEDYQVKYPPMYIFIDKEGYIAFILFGQQTNNDLTKALNTAFDTEYSVADGEMTEQDVEYIKAGQDSLVESIENGEYQKAEDYNQKLLEEALKSNK